MLFEGFGLRVTPNRNPSEKLTNAESALVQTGFYLPFFQSLHADVMALSGSQLRPYLCHSEEMTTS